MKKLVQKKEKKTEETSNKMRLTVGSHLPKQVRIDRERDKKSNRKQLTEKTLQITHLLNVQYM